MESPLQATPAACRFCGHEVVQGVEDRQAYCLSCLRRQADGRWRHRAPRRIRIDGELIICPSCRYAYPAPPDPEQAYCFQCGRSPIDDEPSEDFQPPPLFLPRYVSRDEPEPGAFRSLASLAWLPLALLYLLVTVFAQLPRQLDVLSEGLVLGALVPAVGLDLFVPPQKLRVVMVATAASALGVGLLLARGAWY